MKKWGREAGDTPIRTRSHSVEMRWSATAPTADFGTVASQRKQDEGQEVRWGLHDFDADPKLPSKQVPIESYRL